MEKYYFEFKKIIVKEYVRTPEPADAPPCDIVIVFSSLLNISIKPDGKIPSLITGNSPFSSIPLLLNYFPFSM